MACNDETVIYRCRVYDFNCKRRFTITLTQGLGAMRYHDNAHNAFYHLSHYLRDHPYLTFSRQTHINKLILRWDPLQLSMMNIIANIVRIHMESDL